MTDHRKLLRKRTLKGAKILLARNGILTCTVRNLSIDGACLEFGDSFGIPDTFTLVLDNDPLRRACNVAWRRERRIGIAFA